jgi:hypothetical protein
MPDAARVAQAVPLEVPVVLRGAKLSSDTGKPELFTETARTILVFDNGVVLNIHSRLTVGQTVFIHNTQNGREVLCKVLEAPPDSEPGFTDLEFTTVQQDFWGANLGTETRATEPEARATPPATAAADSDSEERAKMREPSGMPSDDPLAMMLENSAKIDVPSMTNPSKESGMPLREELMSAHEMAPDINAAPISVPDFEPAVTSDKPGSEPTGEQIDAALKQMTSAPLPGTEDEGSSDEKHIAALMARDARLAKFAAFKERQQAEKTQGPAKAADTAAAPAAAPASKRSAERQPEAAESSDHEVKTIGSKPSIGELLTSAKYSKYVMAGACALIAVALFFVWRAMHVPSVQDNFQLASTTTPPIPTPAVPPSGADSIPANSATVNSPQSAASPVRSSRSEASEARTARNRANDAAESDAAAERRRRFTDVHGDPITPAQVISQPQPTLPPWAVDVEVDGIVTLDAALDERGNVTDMKVLSGPRQLQREAERAIGLWEFTPARADGKPVPSHLTLSVQFLPPPPPKRFP